MAEKAQRQQTGADLALDVAPPAFQVLVKFDEAELMAAAAQAIPWGLTEQIQTRLT